MTTSLPIISPPEGYRAGYPLILAQRVLAFGHGALAIVAVASFGWLT
jgi:hypothetical protein